MNRLKHILGVNVPRHVPTTRRSHGACINHSARFRQDGTRLLSKGSKTICKQRSKTKSSVMSLKKSSLESVARGARHYSAHETAKFHGDQQQASRRRALRTMMDDANNARRRNGGFIASVRKYPRSYVEMIADYSEAIRKASAAAARNSNFGYGSAPRNSPFSTLTLSPLGKKMINIAERSEASTKTPGTDSSLSHPLNPFAQSDRCDANDAEHPQRRGVANKKHIRFGPTDPPHDEDRSYVKLIADSSKSARHVSVAPNSPLTPRLSVLARSSLESYGIPIRNASSANNSQAIRRQGSRAEASSSARQSSTQVLTSTGSSKQPQVELHMVPSAKESVVSINVDPIPTGLSGRALNLAEELSVVVRSNNRNTASQSAELTQRKASAAARQGALKHGDFGPMRISISEDSAPIKQIEFSINGKPVSELRSIVARAERLDVVTSPDKIEIRVPFAKDDAAGTSASRSRAEDVLRRRSDSNVEQVLNVHISANFQSEPTKSGTERPRSSPTRNNAATSTSASISPPKSRAKVPSAVFGNDDNVAVDAKHGDAIKSEARKRNASGGSQDSKAQREATRRLSADKSATNTSSVERANDAETGKSDAKPNEANSLPSEANKRDVDDSSDHRVSSGIIPWWSSSGSFNNVRKKNDDVRNERPGTRKLPNASTKAAQLASDAAVGTNNFSGGVSHRKSVEKNGEFDPITQHPSLFRLKLSREGIDGNSEVTRNDPKMKNTETLRKKDGRNWNVEQTSDTRVKEVSDSTKRLKEPKNTQNSILEEDREKRNNYPPKGTNDSFGVSFSTKATNTLNVIKPIEKARDDAQVDYGLKVLSRTPKMKLNSGAKEVQNPSSAATKTQNVISKQSADEVPSKVQMNKAATLKRIESSKTEKLESQRVSLKEQARLENLPMNNAAVKTEFQRSEKLNGLKSLELNDAQRHSKGFTDGQAIQRRKSPLVNTAIKSSRQTKSNPTSKTKDYVLLKNSVDKNPGLTSFTYGTVDKLAKTTKKIDATVEITKKNFTSDSPRNREQNQLRNSKLEKRNSVKFTDPPKKPNNPSDFKSADSKMRKQADVKFCESHVTNFDRNRLNVIGSVAPWAPIDRPEKSVLYSAWLRRFKNDVDSHEKLF